MATLYIAEYSAALGNHGDIGFPQIADENSLLAEQTVTVGSEADSATLNAATRVVRIATDTACHILFAASPTATTSKKYLPANHVEYFGVPASSGLKISVIAHS